MEERLRDQEPAELWKGSFKSRSEISQTLKNIVMRGYYLSHGSDQTTQMSNYEAEAVAMVCQGLANVVDGDMHNSEGWESIRKYSTLVLEQE